MFKYTLTPEEYMEMTAHLMKEKSRTASSVIKLLLFTVGQMAAVAYMVLRESNASRIIRILLVISSLIWAGQTVFRFGFFKTRAKMALTMQKRDDPSGEFWREHHLSKRGNLLSISYGSKKADIPCTRITGIKETENLSLIMSGNSIVEIVPKRITETEDWKAFWADLQETGKQAEKDARNNALSEVLDGALFKASMQLDEDTVVRHLVRMKRHSYRFFSGWTPAGIVIFLLPLIMAGYALTEGSFLYAGVAVLIFFLMNTGHLTAFTPLQEKITRNQLLPPAADGYLLAVTKDKIHLFTRDYQFAYALSDLKHVLDFSDASYYYFPKGQMVFVPAQYRDAFKKAVAHKPSLFELSHMGEKTEKK